MKYKFLLLITIFSTVCVSCEKDRTYEAGKYMVEGQQLFNIIPNAVYDVDGNSYDAVKIGEQVWMKQNLRTTKYADGTSISQGSSTSSTVAYWYYPNDSSSNKSTYGLLYNWKAVMRNSSSSDATPSGMQGICPTGWHVPSDAEWTQLTDYVSSQSQYGCGSGNAHIAKSLSSQTGWKSSPGQCDVGNNPSANNATGFSTLPAGGYDGHYSGFGDFSFFWSATDYNDDDARNYGLNYSLANVYRNVIRKYYGLSVRCLRDEGVSSSVQPPTVTTSTTDNITATSATCGGNVTNDGGGTVTARGVCWNTSQNPTVNDNHTTNGSGTGGFTSNITGLSANTTYYVRAYATNSSGTAYGNEVSFTTTTSDTPQDGQPCHGTPTLTDHDGNTYNTVQIGTQCWMKENLRTTKYADGTTISQGSDTSTTVAYWYYPNDNSSNFSTYGLLYNWKAVMGISSSFGNNPSNVQGVCPYGWHVPSYDEWEQLTDYVLSQDSYICYGDGRAHIAKSLANTIGWQSSDNNCAVGNMQSDNNSTGFGWAPAGGYWGASSYSGKGRESMCWSATEHSCTEACTRWITNTSGYVFRLVQSKKQGWSVRCVKD